MFCPGTAELFLTEADNLFVFSGYTGWAHRGSVSVLPHAWPTIPLPDHDTIKWSSKPSLTIGFMGTGYTESRFGKVMTMLPTPFRRVLLRGDYLKHPDLLAKFNEYKFPLKNLNTFARAETIRVLKKSRHKTAIEVVDRPGFSGTEQEMRKFVDHLINSTYVVCPRGIENFSFRIYEALRYGRVPVIIDTNMVLPSEVDWGRVAIRVPYTELRNIIEIIHEDYNSKSDAEFLYRQRLALETTRYLNSDEWLDKLLMGCLDGSPLKNSSMIDKLTQ